MCTTTAEWQAGSSDSGKDLSFVVDKQLNITFQCKAVAKQVNESLGWINRRVLSRKKKEFTPACATVDTQAEILPSVPTSTILKGC